MIRQAHTYLVGAMGGATLIAIAIAVFVVLVSAQVFRDWPIAALGDGDDGVAVSKAQPVGGAGAGGQAGSLAAGAKAAGASAGANARPGDGSAGGDGGSVAGQGGVATTDGGRGTIVPGGSGGGGGGSQEGGSGSPGAPNSPAPSGSAPGSGTASSGGGSAGGSGGGGSTAGGGASGAASSPSSQVTETVNNTVSGIDESALGGTLEKSGVSAVTEGVVNGVAGPESTVGKVVDEAAGAVGGLLHGNR